MDPIPEAIQKSKLQADKSITPQWVNISNPPVLKNVQSRDKKLLNNKLNHRAFVRNLSVSIFFGKPKQIFIKIFECPLH